MLLTTTLLAGCQLFSATGLARTPSNNDKTQFEAGLVSIVDVKLVPDPDHPNHMFANLLVRGNGLFRPRDYANGGSTKGINGFAFTVPQKIPSSSTERSNLVYAIKDAIKAQQYNSDGATLSQKMTDISHMNFMDIDLMYPKTDAGQDHTGDLKQESEHFGVSDYTQYANKFSTAYSYPSTDADIRNITTQFLWAKLKHSDVGEVKEIANIVQKAMSSVPLSHATSTQTTGISLGNVIYIHCLHGTDRTGAAIIASLAEMHKSDSAWKDNTNYFKDMYIYGSTITAWGGTATGDYAKRDYGLRQRNNPGWHYDELAVNYCNDHNNSHPNKWNCTKDDTQNKLPGYIWSSSINPPPVKREPAVIFVRHAERYNDAGLTTPGIAHAKAYKTMIAVGGSLSNINISAPTVYYTQFPNQDKDSAHPYDTEAFGVYPVTHQEGNFNEKGIVDTINGHHIRRYMESTADDMQAFVNAVKGELDQGHSVWIVWDHGDLPNLINKFAAIDNVNASADKAFTKKMPNGDAAYNLVGVLGYKNGHFTAYNQYNQSYQLDGGPSTITGLAATDLIDAELQGHTITGITLQPDTGAGLSIENTTATWDGTSETIHWTVTAKTALPARLSNSMTVSKAAAQSIPAPSCVRTSNNSENCTEIVSLPADTNYSYTISASDDAADKATATGSFTTSNQPTTCHVPNKTHSTYTGTGGPGFVNLYWNGPQDATYQLEDYNHHVIDKINTSQIINRPVGNPGPDNTYLFYVVSVCDWLGKTSAPTPITVTATPTPPKACPAPIVDGRGGTYNAGQVTLNWTAPDLSNVDHYQLQDWQHGGLADYATIKTTSGPRPVGDPDWTNKDYIFYIVSVCKDGNTSKPALFDVLWHK